MINILNDQNHKTLTSNITTIEKLKFKIKQNIRTNK